MIPGVRQLLSKVHPGVQYCGCPNHCSKVLQGSVGPKKWMRPSSTLRADCHQLPSSWLRIPPGSLWWRWMPLMWGWELFSPNSQLRNRNCPPAPFFPDVFLQWSRIMTLGRRSGVTDWRGQRHSRVYLLSQETELTSSQVAVVLHQVQLFPLLLSWLPECQTSCPGSPG